MEEGSGVRYGRMTEKVIYILLVEDSEDDALLMTAQLTRDGCRIMYERVDNEAAFRAALDKTGWDIIISDYVLPEFGGLETLKITREKGLDIPCLIVSGKIDEETAVAAMKAGARDYIMKDNLKRLWPAVKRELAEAEVRREREKAEKLLRENEKLSSILLNGVPNPIIVFNRDFSIRSVNPAFGRVTGFLPEKMAGIKAPFPWWPEEKKSQYMDDLETFILNGGDQERQFQKKNGELLWVHILSSSVKDESEKTEYYLSIWMDVTAEKRLRQELELLNHRIIRAQEEERLRIARELHEDTIQVLAIIKLELESLLKSLDGKSGEAEKRIRYLQENTEHAMQDIRRYSYELRPGDLEYLGLDVALEQLTKDMIEPGELEIEFKVKGDPRKLNSDVEMVLFRIAQEALHNVRKHARASRAKVNLGYLRDKVSLAIEDNGRGFDPKTELRFALDRGSLGLISMRERAKLIGSKFDVKTGIGKGTVVSIKVENSPEIIPPARGLAISRDIF